MRLWGHRKGPGASGARPARSRSEITGPGVSRFSHRPYRLHRVSAHMLMKNLLAWQWTCEAQASQTPPPPPHTHTHTHTRAHTHPSPWAPLCYVMLLLPLALSYLALPHQQINLCLCVPWVTLSLWRCARRETHSSSRFFFTTLDHVDK